MNWACWCIFIVLMLCLVHTNKDMRGTDARMLNLTAGYQIKQHIKLNTMCCDSVNKCRNKSPDPLKSHSHFYDLYIGIFNFGISEHDKFSLFACLFLISLKT